MSSNSSDADKVKVVTRRLLGEFVRGDRVAIIKEDGGLHRYAYLLGPHPKVPDQWQVTLYDDPDATYASTPWASHEMRHA